MLKISHTGLIIISGLLWLIIGSVLLPLGINFLVESILEKNLIVLSRPLLDNLSYLMGSLDGALILVTCLALIVGYAKGRFVLGKTVKKGVERILSLPNPSSLANIYTKKYYLLLGSMFFIGFLARMTPMDVRGAIDVTIGSALINGAIIYFRYAYQVYTGTLSLGQENEAA